MSLCRFARMMRCMKHMSVGGVRVMGGLIVMPRRVVRGRFLMMLHRVLMVLGSLHVVVMRRMIVGCFLVRSSCFLSHSRFPWLIIFSYFAECNAL